MRQSRRTFLHVAAALAAGALARGQSGERTYRAAVIGRTGSGDYGHGFDTVFQGLQNVTLEAIADSDPNGLAAAAARSGARRQYLDYREMLEKEKPDIVSIAPRVPDCHREMALKALASGAHLMVEKPFTEHLDEADEIVADAEKRKKKIAVGHKNRYSLEFHKMQRLIHEGFLGRVLEMRVQGKQDGRAGGEDLIVLGTHDFDTMRFFFGNPLWCSATVLAGGQPATKADVRKGREPIMVAGDTIRALFQFPDNVLCSWQSVTADKEWNTIPRGKERWGFTIFGTKRILSYYSLSTPLYLDTPFLGHKSESGEWKPLPEPQTPLPSQDDLHLIRDLIRAVETDEQPLCSGVDGRWTIEMLSAVYESHRMGGTRLEFPLKERTSPLLRM